MNDRHTIAHRLLPISASIFIALAHTTWGQANPAVQVGKGMSEFQAGKVTQSIKTFEAAEEADPTLSPYLWQLGISRYYAKQFELGRKQFEIHRRVNPNDVENATWHFICVAKAKGVTAARKAMIPIDTKKDTRVPMTEVYAFYAGQGSPKEVLQAAAKSKLPSAEMYAHLYLGLYYEVDKKIELAKKHMLLAAKAKLKGHYMHDVAKIHVKLRGWDKPIAEKNDLKIKDADEQHVPATGRLDA
jgi:lipoprotein NlpI